MVDDTTLHVTAAELLDRFFTHSVDLLCIAGLDGYFKRVSASFDQLGYAREDLLSRPFLELVHADDREATQREMQRLARGAPTLSFENRYRRSDGSYVWLSWSVAPDPSGLLFGTARDITRRKTLEDEVARERERAIAATSELEAFSYSVAHDLRAPLRSIDGFSQALLEDHGAQLDEEGQRYLKFVRSSAQNMAELIEALLTLARVSRSELQHTDVDLTRLALGVRAKLREQEPHREVDVRIQPGMIAHGDPRLLATLVDNLLQNAWKFTAKKPGATIEMGTIAQRGGTDYFVRDDGAGFDPRYAHKLFAPFQRLHSEDDFPGTGIGLATVARIIRRHGGTVKAEGQLDAGCTVTFTIPQGAAE